MPAMLFTGIAMASTARAQASQKEEADTAKVWGFYRIVDTETGGDGKVLVKVLVRLINRSDENYSLNTTRVLGPGGGFYTAKAVEKTVTAMAGVVTTVRQQFTVSIEDADRLRTASRLALVLWWTMVSK